MQNTNDTISYKLFGDKWFLFIEKTYKGSPIIAWSPDYIVCYNEIYERFKDSFKIDKEKVHFVWIEK